MAKDKNLNNISDEAAQDYASSVALSENTSGTVEEIGTPLTQACFPDVPEGYTYFVRRSDGLIKIGFSFRPHRRLKGLRHKFGALDVLAIVHAPIADEYETHQRFAALRVEGEWFKPDEELLAFIAAAKQIAAAAPIPQPIAKIKRRRDKIDEIVALLIRRRPSMSPGQQQIVSTIVEQVQNLRDYVRPSWAKDERQTPQYWLNKSLARLGG